MTCTEEYREHIEYTFHAFCKVVIRNASYTALRTRSGKNKRETSLEYLTDEKHYPIHLNQNGTFFLARVTGLLNTLEKTVEETRAMAGLERGVVRIAISETIFIKHIIHNFLHQHPDVRISCQLQSDEQIKTSLEEGAINFAVTRSPILGPELTWTPLLPIR